MRRKNKAQRRIQARQRAARIASGEDWPPRPGQGARICPSIRWRDVSAWRRSALLRRIGSHSDYASALRSTATLREILEVQAEYEERNR